MRLSEHLGQVAQGLPGNTFELFSENLNHQWIEQALSATGTATIRRRKLPAELVVWLVIGMALFRDRCIDAVVRHLNLVLPDARNPTQQTDVSRCAVVEARNRLGPAPLAWLFDRTATQWARQSAHTLRWRGLAVFGVDGTSMLVADSIENDAFFGRPLSGRATAAYPQVRLVALMVLGSHLLAGAVFGPYAMSEFLLASSLWPLLPNNSLVIVDRGFVAYKLFYDLGQQSSHWLTRTKAKLRWQVIENLGPGDDLVEVPIHKNTRRKFPELPAVLRARVIRYQQPGFQPQTLLTSLLDPALYPASELITLYHERWELELGFDEVKTHTFEANITLRSTSPARVAQELWGMLIAYNLVRLVMARVAARAQLPPRRVSFRNALLFIRAFLLTAEDVAPGTLPRRLEQLHAELRLLVLPERRSRRYPRAVKIKMSDYPRKPLRARS